MSYAQCVVNLYIKEDILWIFGLSLVLIIVYYIIEFSLSFTGRAKEENIYVVDTKYKVHKFLAFRKVHFFILANSLVLFYFTSLSMIVPYFYSSKDKEVVKTLCTLKEEYPRIKTKDQQIKFIATYIQATGEYELLRDKNVFKIKYGERIDKRLSEIKSKYSIMVSPLSVFTASGHLYRLFVLIAYAFPGLLLYLGHKNFKRKMVESYNELTKAPVQVEPIAYDNEDFKTVFSLNILNVDRQLFKQIIGDVKKVQALFVKSITADVKIFIGDKVSKADLSEGKVVYSAYLINNHIRYVLDEIEKFADSLNIYKLTTKEEARCYLALLLHHYVLSFYGNLPSGLLVVNVKDKTLKRLLGLYSRKLLIRESENMSIYDKKANEVLTALIFTLVFDRDTGLYISPYEYLKSKFDPLPIDL